MNAAIETLRNGEWWEPRRKAELIEAIQRRRISWNERHNERRRLTRVRDKRGAIEAHAQHWVQLLRLVLKVEHRIAAKRRGDPGGARLDAVRQDRRNARRFAVEVERLWRPAGVLHAKRDRFTPSTGHIAARAWKLTVIKITERMGGDPAITTD
jgi:hypothetical protein